MYEANVRKKRGKINVRPCFLQKFAAKMGEGLPKNDPKAAVVAKTRCRLFVFPTFLITFA